MAASIARRELGASELRREAVRCRDVAAARRMPAPALVLEGSSREQAARHAGRDRQSLRDWVHRCNAEGLAGLHDRPRPGPRPRLTPERMAALEKVVDEGPDPERDGVARWRRVDPQARIKERLGVGLHERGVGKLLRRRGFVRLSVRPGHPSGDPAARAAFEQASLAW